MSIVQATTSKVQVVKSLVIENAEMDDNVISELVENHLKDFQAKGVSRAKPIVLKNCTISAEHLELLQTLPKLRMLRLEDCTISGGAKFSETYAHIGKQKDSAPIMSKATEHREIPQEERDNQDAVEKAPASTSHRVLQPGTKLVSFWGLQNYIWEYLKSKGVIHGGDLSMPGTRETALILATSSLVNIVSELLKKRETLKDCSPLELTDKDLQMIQSTINEEVRTTYFISKTPSRATKMKETLKECDACTLGELHTYMKLSCYHSMRDRIWAGFE